MPCCCCLWQVEQEEEFLTNTLQKKLDKVRVNQLLAAPCAAAEAATGALPAAAGSATHSSLQPAQQLPAATLRSVPPPGQACPPGNHQGGQWKATQLWLLLTPLTSTQQLPLRLGCAALFGAAPM